MKTKSYKISNAVLLLCVESRNAIWSAVTLTILIITLITNPRKIPFKDIPNALYKQSPTEQLY